MLVHDDAAGADDHAVPVHAADGLYNYPSNPTHLQGRVKQSLVKLQGRVRQSLVNLQGRVKQSLVNLQGRVVRQSLVNLQGV